MVLQLELSNSIKELSNSIGELSYSIQALLLIEDLFN